MVPPQPAQAQPSTAITAGRGVEKSGMAVLAFMAAPERLKALKEENERRRRKFESLEKAQKEAEDIKAKQALERRKQERLTDDERMRKPWQQPEPPKKPILRAGQKVPRAVSPSPQRDASPGADQRRQEADRARRVWRDGLRAHIEHQRQERSSPPLALPAGTAVTQGQAAAPVALTWAELKVAAEAGFEELVRQQQMQQWMGAQAGDAAGRNKSPYRLPSKRPQGPEPVQVKLLPSSPGPANYAAAPAEGYGEQEEAGNEALPPNTLEPGLAAAQAAWGQAAPLDPDDSQLPGPQGSRALGQEGAEACGVAQHGVAVSSSEGQGLDQAEPAALCGSGPAGQWLGGPASPDLMHRSQQGSGGMRRGSSTAARHRPAPNPLLEAGQAGPAAQAPVSTAEAQGGAALLGADWPQAGPSEGAAAVQAARGAPPGQTPTELQWGLGSRSLGPAGASDSAATSQLPDPDTRAATAAALGSPAAGRLPLRPQETQAGLGPPPRQPPAMCSVGCSMAGVGDDLVQLSSPTSSAASGGSGATAKSPELSSEPRLGQAGHSPSCSLSPSPCCLMGSPAVSDSPDPGGPGPPCQAVAGMDSPPLPSPPAPAPTPPAPNRFPSPTPLSPPAAPSWPAGESTLPGASAPPSSPPQPAFWVTASPTGAGPAPRLSSSPYVVIGSPVAGACGQDSPPLPPPWGPDMQPGRGSGGGGSWPGPGAPWGGQGGSADSQAAEGPGADQQLDPEQLVEFGETDMDGIELTGLNSFDFFGQSGRPPPTASTPGLLSFARNGEDGSLLASADLAAGSDPAGMEPDLCNATAQDLAALTTGGGEGGGEGAHGSSSAVTHGPDPGSGVAGQCGAGRSAAARQASPARPVSDEAQRGAAPPQPHDQAAACEQHLEQRLQEQQEEQQLDQQSRQQEQQEQQEHLRRHIVEGKAAAAAGESPGQQLHQGGGHTAPGQLDGTPSHCTHEPSSSVPRRCSRSNTGAQQQQQPGHGAPPADLTSPHDTQQRASDLQHPLLQQLGGREQGLAPGSGEPSTSRDSASSLAACGGRPWGKRRERKRMGAEAGLPQALAESSSSSQAVAGQQGEVGDALAQVACSHGGPGQQQQQLVGVPPGPCRAVQDLAGPLAPAADLSRSPLMASPQHQQTSLPTVQLEAEHQAAPAPAAPHVQVEAVGEAALTQADTLSPSPSASSSSSSQGEAASTTHPHPYIPEPVPCMSPAEGQEAGAQQQGVLPAASPGGAAGGGPAGSKETTPAAAGTEAACPPALDPAWTADLGPALPLPQPLGPCREAKGGQGAPGPSEAGDPLDAATLALYAEMQALSALRQALKREFEALGHGQAVAGIDPWQPQDTAAGSAQGGALGQEPGTQAEPSQGLAPPAADSDLGEAVEGWGAVARARGSLSEGVTGPACAPALAALPVAAPVQLPSTLADPAAAPSPPRLQSGGQTAPPAPLLRWTLPGLAPAPGSSRPPAAQRSLDRQPPPPHPLQPVAPQPELPPGAAPQAHAPALPLPDQQLDTAAVAYGSSGATGDEGAGGHATGPHRSCSRGGRCSRCCAPTPTPCSAPLRAAECRAAAQAQRPAPHPALRVSSRGLRGWTQPTLMRPCSQAADQVAGAAAGSGPGQRGSGVWAGGQAEEQQGEQAGPVLWQGGGPLGVCDGQQGQQGLEATLGAPGMTPAAAPPPFTHHPQTSSQHLDLLHVLQQQQQLAQGGYQAPPHHLAHPSPQLGHCSSVPGQPDPPPPPTLPPASPPSTSSATTSGLATQQQTLRSSSAPRQLLLAPHEPTPPGLAYQVPPAQQQQPLAAAQGPWAAPAATGAAGAAGGGKAGQGPEGGGLAEQHSGWHALRPNTLDAPPGSGPAAPGGESSRVGGPGKKPRPAASPARVRGGGAPPALERPLVLEGSYVQAAVEARARAEREAQARAALAPAPRPTALQRSLSDTGPAVGLAAPSWAPCSAADAGSPVQAALAGAHRVQPGTGPQAVPGPYPGQAKAAPPLPQPQGPPPLKAPANIGSYSQPKLTVAEQVAARNAKALAAAATSILGATANGSSAGRPPPRPLGPHQSNPESGAATPRQQAGGRGLPLSAPITPRHPSRLPQAGVVSGGLGRPPQGQGAPQRAARAWGEVGALPQLLPAGPQGSRGAGGRSSGSSGAGSRSSSPARQAHPLAAARGSQVGSMAAVPRGGQQQGGGGSLEEVLRQGEGAGEGCGGEEQDLYAYLERGSDTDSSPDPVGKLPQLASCRQPLRPQALQLPASGMSTPGSASVVTSTAFPPQALPLLPGTSSRAAADAAAGGRPPVTASAASQRSGRGPQAFPGSKPASPFTAAIQELIGLPGAAPLLAASRLPSAPPTTTGQATRAAPGGGSARAQGHPGPGPGPAALAELSREEQQLLASLQRLDTHILARGLAEAGLLPASTAAAAQPPRLVAQARGGGAGRAAAFRSPSPHRPAPGAAMRGEEARLPQQGRLGTAGQGGPAAALTASIQADQLRQSIEHLDIRLEQLRGRMAAKGQELSPSNPPAGAPPSSWAADPSAARRPGQGPTAGVAGEGVGVRPLPAAPPGAGSGARGRTPTPNRAKAAREQRQAQLLSAAAGTGPGAAPAGRLRAQQQQQQQGGGRLASAGPVLQGGGAAAGQGGGVPEPPASALSAPLTQEGGRQGPGWAPAAHPGQAAWGAAQQPGPPFAPPPGPSPPALAQAQTQAGRLWGCQGAAGQGAGPRQASAPAAVQGSTAPEQDTVATLASYAAMVQRPVSQQQQQQQQYYQQQQQQQQLGQPQYAWGVAGQVGLDQQLGPQAAAAAAAPHPSQPAAQPLQHSQPWMQAAVQGSGQPPIQQQQQQQQPQPQLLPPWPSGGQQAPPQPSLYSWAPPAAPPSAPAPPQHPPSHLTVASPTAAGPHGPSLRASSLLQQPLLYPSSLATAAASTSSAVLPHYSTSVMRSRSLTQQQQAQPRNSNSSSSSSSSNKCT
ncbi:hypothetical protein QJQ45_012169 [Haematococcus lacustris]|nr:hypothetical protein QJQ45_012169 [Haematococcus lacustris]